MPASTWVLAIDFGTSYTLAASRRTGTPSGWPAEVIEIDGERRMPSVVMVTDDAIVVGRAADDMAAVSPARVLRTPKSRLGDPTPIVLGGRPYQAVQLVAEILGKVYAEAVRFHGSPPSSTRLTFPASWSGQRRNQLLRAAEMADLVAPLLVPEPIAAAIAYSETVALAPGQHVLIYDLGGGTFDCAVLRATDLGFEVVGRPGGDRQLGGELFDELIANALGDKLAPDVWEQLQLREEAVWLQAWVGLRREARRAKESLSGQQSVDLLIALPNGIRELRFTRDELEAVVGPYLADTTHILQQTILDAGVGLDDIDAVYLVGGASRMPMVERLVVQVVPNAIVSNRGDPKAVVALGATHPSLTASAESLFPATEWVTDPQQLAEVRRDEPDRPVPPTPATLRVPTIDVDRAAVAQPGLARPRRRSRIVALLVVVMLAVVGVGLALALGDDDERDTAESPESTPLSDGDTVGTPPQTITSDAVGGPAPDHEIVFSSNRSGDFELITMYADGTGQWIRTENSVDDKFPAWSPDGQRIAWTRGGDIAVMNADGSNVANLTDDIAEPALKPAWTADGQTIVFVRLVSGHFEIWSMAASGGTAQPVVTFESTGRDAYDPAVTADGTVIYSSRRTADRVDLFATDLTGTMRRPLLLVNGDSFTNEVVDIANTSATMTFSRLVASGQYDVMMATTDGEGLQNLTESVIGGQVASDSQGSWSPDDSAMVLVSALDGDWEIWRMNADGTSAQQLTGNLAKDADPDWRVVPPG